MKKIFVIIIVSLSWFAGYSQDLLADAGVEKSKEEVITIKGTLSEMVNGEKVAVPFANVFIEGTTDLTVSDFDGTFSITTSKTDGIVKFTFKGYEQVIKPINLDGEKSLELDVVLEKI